MDDEQPQSRIPVPKHLTLMELPDSGACKWPFGPGPYTFCGNQTQRGIVYCEYHRHVAGGLYRE